MAKIVDLGPKPIANNAVPALGGESFGTPPHFDLEAFTAKNGSPQAFFNKIVTGVLRPTMKAEQTQLDQKVIDQATFDRYVDAKASKQATAIRYFEGKASFDELCTVLGGGDVMAIRGEVAINEIADLGAA